MTRQYSTRITNNHYRVNPRSDKTHADRPALMCRLCRELRVKRY